MQQWIELLKEYIGPKTFKVILLLQLLILWFGSERVAGWLESSLGKVILAWLKLNQG